MQQAVGAAARDIVTGLIEKTPLDNPFLDAVAGQVTQAAVDSLLANPAAQSLIASLAGDVLNGTPTSDLIDTVLQAVINSPQLQIAFGMAVGAGIGSLLGSNPVAFAVGQVIGATTALVIGMASGTALLIERIRSLTAPSAVVVNAYLIDPARASSAFVATVQIGDGRADGVLRSSYPAWSGAA
ncbi:hypothetical protein ACXDF8_25295 [Mycolicibacterium sp. CBM1]